MRSDVNSAILRMKSFVACQFIYEYNGVRGCVKCVSVIGSRCRIEQR